MDGIDLNKSLEDHGASFRYFAPHEHHVTRFCKDNVLLLVFDGVLRFEEDGVSYEVGPGEWHIQHEKSYQSGPEESAEPRYLYVHFGGEWSEQGQILPCRGRFPISEMMPYMEKMNHAAHYAATLLERNGAFHGLLTQLYLLEMNKKQDSVAYRIVQRLTEDIAHPPSLGALGQEFSYSNNQLIRIVKKEFGMSPYACLQAERLKTAARLLETSSLPVVSILEQCGYGDYTQFYKAFKKQYGIAPGMWRQRKQQYPPSVF